MEIVTAYIIKVIGAGIGLALIVYGLIKYGQKKEKLEVAKANIEAVKGAKDTKEGIDKLPSAQLRDRAGKFVRPK